MPIYANKEALEFWEKLPESRRARSLATGHFAILGKDRDDKEWRKAACGKIQNAASHQGKADSHQSFLSQLIEQGAVTIFAKLEASMILNAGDGVIENGGISLDRNSGLPCIPGSAIKAAARRYAIQELGNSEDQSMSARLLADIALTFGYGDTEWKSGRDSKHHHSHSDFWLAMNPISAPGEEYDGNRNLKWAAVSEQAAAIIFQTLNLVPIQPEETLVPQLPNLKGCVNFLPAFPTNSARIETDVLTPHHIKYYDGKQPVATDDENPVPIFFPVVRKGTGYQFVLQANGLPHAQSHLQVAKDWLAQALTFLGIGAKTNAGYGWFKIDLSAQAKADRESEEKAAAIAREAELAALTPEERAREELGELSHEDFVRIIKNLENEDAEQQRIVCQMLTDSKKEDWKSWKKAKKWKERIPSIREIASTHGIELI